MSAPRRHVYLCRCGHWIYTHASRSEPNTGGRTYVGCRERDCSCRQFRNHEGGIFHAGDIVVGTSPEAAG